jgi:acyl dehydratase
MPAEVQTVEELKDLVGQELGVGAWTQITQEQVNTFADLTGDHQYITSTPSGRDRRCTGAPSPTAT